MKDVIGSVLFIISLVGGGNYALREVHAHIRKAALERAAKGLPSLTSLTQSLRGVDYKKK
jgi:hypothetical protein